ncbi:cysteine dioxygenase, partial [Mycobacterium sp. ITM-2017-0098]
MTLAPTRLRPADLLHVTDRFADDVLGGEWPAGREQVVVVAAERWFTRLHGNDELDVWLISWVPDRSTELHDHGGSLGALTV